MMSGLLFLVSERHHRWRPSVEGDSERHGVVVERGG
jgi:hypothetical protein